MINDSYKVLGLGEYATDREISEAYFSLKKKYQEERFLEGEKGNDAAKKLTELEQAYNEIITYRREHSQGENEGLYAQVDAAIKAGDLKKAQDLLDSFNERLAEWHYLQAVVFYKKQWANESKKQLEIAMNLEPNNAKYKETYDRLVSRINATGQNADWNHSGTTGGGARGGSYGEPTQQMGGDSCMDFCCRLAICNVLLNCCCNCR